MHSLKTNHFIIYKGIFFLSIFLLSCSSNSESNDDLSDLIEEIDKNETGECTVTCEAGVTLNTVTCECEDVYPLSDPTNTQGWVINEEISDEFDAEVLDEDKWHIQGKGGVYVSNFIGRAPSEFSINNVQQEDGKLKIISKWEPDFDFNKTKTQTVGGVVYKYENITTAALVGKRYFKYGYMEIKSKSANAPVTSSFWTTTPSTETHKSELDMFETFGGHKTSDSWRKRLKYNAISWDPNNKYYLPDGLGPAYTTNIQVPHNTADGFHVYGFEWAPDYIKVYIDGVLHSNGNLTKALVTNNGTDPERWVTDVDYKIWLDSETFPWLGLPTADDLPATYEIEYVRVWQKD